MIRWRFILGRLMLVFLGMLISLSFLEIYLHFYPIPTRFAFGDQLQNIWQSDDELLLHLRPNLDQRISAHPELKFTVRTNKVGLRDEPVEGQSFDIAAIGDSFTFGFGVEQEETWSDRLEVLSDLRVVNLGWVGWNSYVYPSAIRRHAVPLQAKTWIWTFFTNDLLESVAAEEFLSSGKTDYLAYASQDSQLSFPLNLRVVQTLALIFNPDLALLPNSGAQLFDNGSLKLRLSDYPWTTSSPDDPKVEQGWELTQQALQEAQELARENNVTLIIAFIPAREHVYWPIVSEAMPDFDVRQLDDVGARLQIMCEELDILYLDLLPGLREAALPDKVLYFEQDGHWNAQGHQVAAGLMYEFLQQEEFVNP